MGTACHIDGSWGEFRGDDVTYPIDMCLRVIEMKARKQNWNDEMMIKDLMNVIPDTVNKDDAHPSMVWKQCLMEYEDPIVYWGDIKLDVLTALKPSLEYTMYDKLLLLNSVVKKENEHITDYLVRIICLVSLIETGGIPNSAEGLQKFHAKNKMWIKLLFLFGLNTSELDSVLNIADTAHVEQLGQVLSGHLVKVEEDNTSLATNDQEDDSTQLKDLRAIHEMSTAQFAEAGLCRYCALKLPTGDDNSQEHISKCSRGEKPYKCLVCSHVNGSIYMRNHHVLKTHCSFTEFSCRICYKASGSEEKLRIHMFKEHDMPLKWHGMKWQSFKEAFQKKDALAPKRKRKLTTKTSQPVEILDPSKVKKSCQAEETPKQKELRAVHELSSTQFQDKRLCRFCTIQLPICEKEMDAHQDTCSQGENPFKCPVCPHKSVSFYERNYHVIRAHCLDPNDFGCSFCNQTFKSKNGLEIHVANSHDVMSEQIKKKKKVVVVSNVFAGSSCDFCSDETVFKTKVELQNHQKESHKEAGRYQCKRCSFKCIDCTEMMKHWHLPSMAVLRPKKGEGDTKKSVEGEEKEVEEWKKLLIQQEEDLKKANKHAFENCKEVYEIPDPVSITDTGKPKWTCHQCDEVGQSGEMKTRSESKKSYVEHVRNVHNSVFHHCYICSVPVSSCRRTSWDGNIIYALHLFKKHAVLTKGYVNSVYMCHFKLDSGEYCNHRSVSKWLCTGHVKSHHRKDLTESEQCPTCGKVFVVSWGGKSYLNVHIKQEHSDMKPSFLCNTCGQSFNGHYKLKDHERRQHEEKTLTCDKCPNPGNGRTNKLFNRLTLQTHKKDVHGKIHKCTKCDYKKCDLLDVVSHYRSHHLKYLQFVCSHCSKMFNNSINTKYHYQSVHSNNRERKIDTKFWAKEENRVLIRDRKYTDPDYPTDNKIKEILKQDAKGEMSF